MRNKILLLLLLILASFFSERLFAQDDIRVKQEGKTIVVEYDLSRDAISVNLFVSQDGGKTYKGPLKQVTGDLDNISAGPNKQIRWDVVKEYGGLEGDVSFKIIKKLKKQWQEETFFTLNGAFSVAPQFSCGLTFGHVKHFGWYVSLMSGTGFQGFSPDMISSNSRGAVDGKLPFYTGEKSTSRISVMAGGMLKITDPLCLKIGLGYGNRTLCWQTADEKWVKNDYYSPKGVDLAIGLQGNIKGFVISLEAVTTNFKTLETKLGLGYSFIKKK